jgi:hypothetical protein
MCATSYQWPHGQARVLHLGGPRPHLVPVPLRHEPPDRGLNAAPLEHAALHVPGVPALVAEAGAARPPRQRGAAPPPSKPTIFLILIFFN